MNLTTGHRIARIIACAIIGICATFFTARSIWYANRAEQLARSLDRGTLVSDERLDLKTPNELVKYLYRAGGIDAQAGVRAGQVQILKNAYPNSDLRLLSEVSVAELGPAMRIRSDYEGQLREPGSEPHTVRGQSDVYYLVDGSVHVEAICTLSRSDCKELGPQMSTLEARILRSGATPAESSACQTIAGCVRDSTDVVGVATPAAMVACELSAATSVSIVCLDRAQTLELMIARSRDPKMIQMMKTMMGAN